MTQTNDPQPPTKHSRPEIYKYLDCSTGHITWRDQELLVEDAQCGMFEDATHPVHGLIVYQYLEGFWVHCYTGPGSTQDRKQFYHQIRERGYSEEFAKVLITGGDYDCTFVRFDRDGKLYDTWTRFDWEAEKKQGHPVPESP